VKCWVVFLRKYKSLAAVAQLGRNERGPCSLNTALQERQNHWWFLFLFKRKNVIFWPALNRNFIKEAAPLCVSTGSSLIETPCFVVPCYCIVIVHRSLWQPLTRKAPQYKGENKERNNCIKFVYPLNKVAIFPTICHKVIVLLSSCSKF